MSSAGMRVHHAKLAWRKGRRSVDGAWSPALGRRVGSVGGVAGGGGVVSRQSNISPCWLASGRT
jgi:hypothetical protein